MRPSGDDDPGSTHRILCKLVYRPGKYPGECDVSACCLPATEEQCHPRPGGADALALKLCVRHAGSGWRIERRPGDVLMAERIGHSA